MQTILDHRSRSKPNDEWVGENEQTNASLIGNMAALCPAGSAKISNLPHENPAAKSFISVITNALRVRTNITCVEFAS